MCQRHPKSQLAHHMIHHIFKSGARDSNRSSVKSQPKPRKQSLNATQLQSQEGRGSGGGMMVYAYWYLFTAAVRFFTVAKSRHHICTGTSRETYMIAMSAVLMVYWEGLVFDNLLSI
jgi:hypothetical protein